MSGAVFGGKNNASALGTILPPMLEEEIFETRNLGARVLYNTERMESDMQKGDRMARE